MSGARKLIVAIDVANNKMMAGFAREDGAGVRLVKWTSPLETRAFVELVMRTARLLDVARQAITFPEMYTRTLRQHRQPLLNWFRARGAFAMGAVEGFNNKARVTTKMAYGFKRYEHAETALFHRLGDLLGQSDASSIRLRGTRNLRWLRRDGARIQQAKRLHSLALLRVCLLAAGRMPRWTQRASW